MQVKNVKQCKLLRKNASYKMRKNASNEPLIHDAQPHFGQKSLIYT